MGIARAFTQRQHVVQTTVLTVIPQQTFSHPVCAYFYYWYLSWAAYGCWLVKHGRRSLWREPRGNGYRCVTARAPTPPVIVHVGSDAN